MLPQLGGLVFGIQDGQLGEHAHVCSFKTQRGLKETHHLLKVAPILIVVDEVFQLVGVHNDVEAAHLGQAKLVVVNASKTHLFPRSSAKNKTG
jgi:hypothetical protein